MATTIRYETKTCGRCGGSGRYSYCAMYGTTCFGCSGSGKVLSARGKKAVAAVEAWKQEHCTIPVEAVEAGMRIELGRSVSKSGRVTITKGAHSHIFTRREDCGRHVEIGYNLKSASGVITPNGYGLCAGTRVIVAPSGDTWNALVAFARTFKGAIVEEGVAA